MGKDKNNIPNPNFEFEKDGITIEDIKGEAEKQTKQDNAAPENIGLFHLRTANQVMKEASEKPIPKMLFDELWLEGELCVLFADTGVGKTSLAVQIGDSISRGKPIQCFNQEGILIHSFKLEAPPQQVIYFDFELSDKQFERRYTNNFLNPYTFSDNFIRVDFSDAEIPEGDDYNKFLYDCFEQVAQIYPSKIFIVDNLTKLRTLDTDKAREAKPLMDFLDKLKKQYGVSILALEHTRKRDESREISLNDLQGSAMKSRFIDAAFAIGRSSQDAKIRFIKQMKERSSEKKYGSENVIVCKIDKPSNFLQYEFLNYGNEREHLRIESDDKRNELESKVAEILTSNPAEKAYSIAKQLCTEENKFESFRIKIDRIIKKISKRNSS